MWAPFWVGLVAGLLASAVLTYACHRMTPEGFVRTMLAAVIAGSVPGFIIEVIAHHSNVATDAYIFGWILSSVIVFPAGILFGAPIVAKFGSAPALSN